MSFNNTVMLMKQSILDVWNLLTGKFTYDPDGSISNNLGTIIAVNQIESKRSIDGGNTWLNISILCDSISYGNGKFVGIGSSYSVSSVSSDGIIWNTYSMGISGLNGISFGNGIFVSIGNNICYTSTDGINWTSRTIILGNWNKIMFDGTNFLCTADGSQTYCTSPNGINWTSRLFSFNGGYSNFSSGLGLIGGVVTIGGVNYPIYSNDNGITFTKGSALSISGGSGVSFGNGKFIIVSYSNKYLITTDFISFIQGNLPLQSTLCIYDLYLNIFISYNNLGDLAYATL